jgi:hypothetical protein
MNENEKLPNRPLNLHELEKPKISHPLRIPLRTLCLGFRPSGVTRSSHDARRLTSRRPFSYERPGQLTVDCDTVRSAAREVQFDDVRGVQANLNSIRCQTDSF